MGHLPVASVTSAQLDAAVSTPTLTASTRRFYVTVLRHFFRWLQTQGCLPLCRPTAADHLPLPSISPVSSPLRSADLRKLLTLAKDVDVRLYLTVSVFAGLRPQEILNLSWEDFTPGATILVNSKCHRFRRVVAISSTLDAWLRPFYGAKGPLVSEKLNEFADPRLSGNRHPRASERDFEPPSCPESAKGNSLPDNLSLETLFP